jgi:hypothetical protein
MLRVEMLGRDSYTPLVSLFRNDAHCDRCNGAPTARDRYRRPITVVVVTFAPTVFYFEGVESEENFFISHRNCEVLQLVGLKGPARALT